MHRLMVSDEVMARLKALSRDAGQTEDRVLRRLLGCPPEAAPDGDGDFIDATYAIRFAEGFRIFRTYKGRPYTARVARGRWVLEGDAVPAGTFDSLNQLSQAVIDGNENAWMFWFYRTAGGDRRRIAELRDPALVQRRPRRNHRPGPVGTPMPAPLPPPATPVPDPPAASGSKPWEPKQPT